MALEVEATLLAFAAAGAGAVTRADRAVQRWVPHAKAQTEKIVVGATMVPLPANRRVLAGLLHPRFMGGLAKTRCCTVLHRLNYRV